jgi:hypothetical protein
MPPIKFMGKIAVRRVVWQHLVLLGLWLFGTWVSCSDAQPLSNLVFSVGTTIRDVSLNDWSYVLVGAPEQQLLAGKQFAVFGKNGFPTNSGTFSLRGTMLQQTDTTTINALLNQSVALGDDLVSLSNALNILLHSLPGITNETLPQKVLTAFQTATTDPGVASALSMLEGMHPGLTRCAGRAFAETITTATTYEVREVNPNTSAVGEAIGRVTIVPGSPMVLPAPGFPFQVVTNAPSDHLRIRLRWGTPDPLRRLALLQFGFNVWRIPLAAALAGNFNTTPPSLTTLYANTNFTRVNTLPVMATKDYAPLAGPNGPDDASDRVTFFVSDSNGRSPGNAHFPAGQTPLGYLVPPFNDGEQFYYFITARDVLGRDGLVSPGGPATACRKDLPSAPTKLAVFNAPQIVPLGAGVTNQPHLLLRWLQNTNPADVVSQYWVYRWPNTALALTNDATPSNNLIGIVAQIPNTNFNFLLDTNPTAPAAPGPSNFWYTVRAASLSACGSWLFSPNSPPASGVLRQHAAPPATTGELIGSCGTPVAIFQQFNSLPNPGGADTNYWHYRVTVTRRDTGIAWAQLFVGNNSLQVTQAFGPLYFPPDGNSLSVDLQQPPLIYNPEFDVSCQVGTYYGVVSQAAVCQTTNPPALSQITEAVFEAGDLLFTALSSGDPFFQALNFNQSSCLPALGPTRDASGTVHMRFDVGGSVPLMIQYATNANTAQFWTDVGIATPDTNGVYSIYLCPCVISPLPPLRGCKVNLPGDGNCDQHVARAGNSGPIAPIHIRFRLTPRTHEYRLYRSVNGGPPTLLAQSTALFDTNNPAFEIVRTDDGMPPTAARLCYFVQVLDENGNGSPLALIGCKDVVPPKPPTPVLSQPAPAGTTTNPEVALSWFCPTAGVYRFEIRLERADQPGSGKPTGFINPQLIKLTAFKPLQYAPTNSIPHFYGLIRNRNLVSTYDEWQLTPPLGPGFGPGPQFAITAGVVPNVPYRISVAAENIQGYWGDASTEWTFVWQPPPAFPTVPWPARPLPPVTLFDDPSVAAQSVNYAPRVSAVVFTTLVSSNLTLADTRYPVGIRIGEASYTYFFGNIGTTNFAAYYEFSAYGLRPDPNASVFKRLSANPQQNGQPLLPIVVYRQQVTNANFPRVSGNLAQVTPLLESLPWNINPNDYVTIPDLLIGASFQTVFRQSHQFLYLRDQQPVILGARYHYYVVRFNDQREVAEVIDAGTVDIPSS